MTEFFSTSYYCWVTLRIRVSYLVLVGGVEGNLADLGVPPSEGLNGPHLQFKALQQSGL